MTCMMIFISNAVRLGLYVGCRERAALASKLGQDQSRLHFGWMSFADENEQESNHKILFVLGLPVPVPRARCDSLQRPSAMDCGLGLPLTLQQHRFLTSQ